MIETPGNGLATVADRVTSTLLEMIAFRGGGRSGKTTR
jgi:hypothetical protein